MIPPTAIADVLADAGFVLTRAGRDVRTHCPFHGDRTPSFHIYLSEDGHAHCYGGCHRSYGLFDVLQQVKGWSRAETQRWIAAQGWGELPRLAVVRAKAATVLSEPQRLALTIASGLWAAFLRDETLGHTALHWLRTVRRVDGPQRELALASVGLAPQAPEAHRAVVAALVREFGPLDGPQLGRQIGVLTKEGEQRLTERVTFSCRDRLGRTIYYQARALRGGQRAKYLNPPRDLAKRVYRPLTRAQAQYPGTVWVEGPLDALAYAAAGFYAVALMGSAIPTASVVRRYSAPHLIALDVDPPRADGQTAAGPAARAKLSAICAQAGLPYTPVDLPVGSKDPSEWLARVGPAAFIAQNERTLLCLLDAASLSV